MHPQPPEGATTPDVLRSGAAAGASSPAKVEGATGVRLAIHEHELLRRIGHGAYGEVWLARNALGAYRAVKVVYRKDFEDSRPFEREFRGIQKFEPISHSHEGLVNILQVGRHEDYFYYVMELADDAGESPNDECRMTKEARNPNVETKATSGTVRHSSFDIPSTFVIRHSSF